MKLIGFTFQILWVPGFKQNSKIQIIGNILLGSIQHWSPGAFSPNIKLILRVYSVNRIQIIEDKMFVDIHEIRRQNFVPLPPPSLLKQNLWRNSSQDVVSRIIKKVAQPTLETRVS